MNISLKQDYSGKYLVVVDKHGDARCWNRVDSIAHAQRSIQQLRQSIRVDGEDALEWETLPAITKTDEGKLYVAY